MRRQRNGKPANANFDNDSSSDSDSDYDSSSSSSSIISSKRPKPKNDAVRRVFRPRGDVHYKLETSIQQEIAKREIAMDQVYKLDLTMDDYIWFEKHIKIRNNMNDDGERYTLANSIYQKYIKLQDTDHRKLEDLKKKSNTEISIVKKILDS